MIERATLLCVGGEITPEHLPDDVLTASSARVEGAPGAAISAPALGGPESDRIVRVLNEFAGNQSRAAKALGIARSTLVERLEEYNIPRSRKPGV